MIIASIILTIVCLIISILILIKLNKPESTNATESIEKLLQSEVKNIRTDLNDGFRNNREELNKGIATFQQSFMDSLQRTSEMQTQAFEKLIEKVENKLQLIKDSQDLSSKDNRDELRKSLKEFQVSFSQNVKDFNDLQKQKFEEMTRKQDELVKSTELKLEKMRETVDEKLHKTLEERLGQSFKMVSEQLQAVQKGLGEMQTLALGVGDLKKVLSNVKTRGVMGEIQLGNILEQIMAPEQYAANVKTKPGSNDLVEFAIKLPGKDDAGKEVYLPIDAKFPQDDYVRLQTAYDLGDTIGIDIATKSLNASIKKFAKDISEKYIAPPHTTDFGIMFLPLEGLFAEVVRQPELIATLQREYKIIVTGPTTLAAILNSLQMGFKTLAIQKRSSEVWQILSTVKAEFGKFGDVLVKAQKKIQEASSEIDTLVTTRTNSINRQLKNVQEMPIDSGILNSLEDDNS
jgi:DNA recombination protein RmuC